MTSIAVLLESWNKGVMFWALLRSVWNHLVDHTSLAVSIQDFLRQYMNRTFAVCFQVILTTGHHHSAWFRSVRSSVVETHRVMLCQNVSFVPTYFNGCLAGSASELTFTKSSDPLGPKDARPLSSRVA